MIVLDCSAAVEIVRKTADGGALKTFMLEGGEVVAPSLFHEELASTFWKLVRADVMSKDKAIEYIKAAEGLVERFIPPDDFVIEAMCESLKLHHPTYDMFYLVLARRCGATLLTIDQKLIDLCDQQGVDCVYQIET